MEKIANIMMLPLTAWNHYKVTDRNSSSTSLSPLRYAGSHMIKGFTFVEESEYILYYLLYPVFEVLTELLKFGNEKDLRGNKKKLGSPFGLPWYHFPASVDSTLNSNSTVPPAVPTLFSIFDSYPHWIYWLTNQVQMIRCRLNQFRPQHRPQTAQKSFKPFHSWQSWRAFEGVKDQSHQLITFDKL